MQGYSVTVRKCWILDSPRKFFVLRLFLVECWLQFSVLFTRTPYYFRTLGHTSVLIIITS